MNIIQQATVYSVHGTYYGIAELMADGRLYYRGRKAADGVTDLVAWFAEHRPHCILR